MANNSIDDLKTLKGYALGVAGFATAISTILIQALHFPAEPTLLTVIGFAGLMLLIAYLINRSEQRQTLLLKSHTEEADMLVNELKEDLAYLKDMALETQRSTLRTEMNDEIHRNPANHDTILKMAERYFITLKADWVQTNLFLDWVENERQAGREVHVPPALLENVTTKYNQEQK